jgi:sec-independent protein translocase protein TatB
MFDIGWSELVVIAVVALIAIGPKELPAVLRTVGQYMGKIRRMASEFQGQFQEAMREAEMADIKKSVDEMTDAAKGVTDSFTNYDPLADVKKEVESFSTDPLGASAAASASSISPEAAAPTTPVPLSPDAGIEPLAVAPAAEAPQPQPEASSETKPASGSGA